MDVTGRAHHLSASFTEFEISESKKHQSPGENQRLTLTFVPTPSLSYNKAMMIRARSSRSGLAEVPTQLEVLPKEAPTLSDSSLEKYLGSGKLVKIDLLLLNPGSTTLEFTAELAWPREILDEFHLSTYVSTNLHLGVFSLVISFSLLRRASKYHELVNTG